MKHKQTDVVKYGIREEFLDIGSKCFNDRNFGQIFRPDK
jgi:hypothetical protein